MEVSKDSPEGKGEHSQQSGDKSSSVLETEEELHTQKVSKVIAMYLRENEDWKTYIKECVEPIIELEKGKLC